MSVSVIELLYSIIRKFNIWRLKNQGLQISSDCRIMGWPHFGSEPYLISIGRHVTISSNVAFVTHDGGTWVFRDIPGYENAIKYGRITIKDNCFIGFGSIILPGVKIGPNSVVAAGSVVTKDVPPDTVVAGSPAREIRTVDEYARICLTETPEYDLIAYNKNKKRELLRIFPFHND